MVLMIFIVIIGILGFGMIFFDFMQFFSMKVIEQPSGNNQSKITTVGLVLIVISVSLIVYKFIGI